jgi:hypothetical protein
MWHEKLESQLADEAGGKLGVDFARALRGLITWTEFEDIRQKLAQEYDRTIEWLKAIPEDTIETILEKLSGEYRNTP